MTKSSGAFRTISEASGILQVAPHVLRFWESKFRQIRPIKSDKGRRLYRPEDIALIGNIKYLLHERGMTIRGVQKFLQEKGVDAVRAPDFIASGQNPNDPPAPADADPQTRKTLQAVRERLVKARNLLPQ